MNKQQYLEQLNEQLQYLPRKAREDIMYDVLRRFEKGAKEGKSESFIIHDLGKSEELVDKYITSDQTTINKTPMSNEKLTFNFKIILVIVLNGMFVLGPSIAIAGVLIALYAIGFSLIAAPIVLFVRMIFFSSSNPIVLFFITLFLASLGTLIFTGSAKLGSWLKRLLIKYIQFNKRIIKGENVV